MSEEELHQHQGWIHDERDSLTAQLIPNEMIGNQNSNKITGKQKRSACPSLV